MGFSPEFEGKQFSLNDSLLFSRPHKKIPNTLALRTRLVPVVSRRLAVRTIFPVTPVDGTSVRPITSLFRDCLTTATVHNSTVVTSCTTLRTVRNGEISLQHISMVRPRPSISQPGVMKTGMVSTNIIFVSRPRVGTITSQNLRKYTLQNGASNLYAPMLGWVIFSPRCNSSFADS